MVGRPDLDRFPTDFDRSRASNLDNKIYSTDKPDKITSFELSIYINKTSSVGLYTCQDACNTLEHRDFQALPGKNSVDELSCQMSSEKKKIF